MTEDTVVPEMLGVCTDMTPEPTSADDASAQQLRLLLRKDLTAVDLKWSLFVAASQSYKHDSCLRPFPPMFVQNGNKDISALTIVESGNITMTEQVLIFIVQLMSPKVVGKELSKNIFGVVWFNKNDGPLALELQNEAVESVPAFCQLEARLSSLPAAVVQLLCWVLVDLKEPSLTVIDKSQVSGVLGLVRCELAVPCPALLLSLDYDPTSPTELRWAEARSRHGSIFAFHGSKLENFHSILHTGLQQHLTKNALFGQGVYLSSELQVCLPYSRNGLGWGLSSVASQFSVVALCEIQNLTSVHCRTTGAGEDSVGGQMPHKLYVVPNSDLVRVRYLLVYTTQAPFPQNLRLSQPRSGLLAWLGRHKMAASLLAYAVMLTSVGLSRSPTALRYWRQFCHTLGIRY